MIGASAYLSLGIGLELVRHSVFGLTVITMVDAIGHITGCHLNPAVSIGLVTSDRFPANQLIPYTIAQVLGAIPATGVLYLIARGSGYEGGLTPNGCAAHSLGGYYNVCGFSL